MTAATIGMWVACAGPSDVDSGGPVDPGETGVEDTAPERIDDTAPVIETGSVPDDTDTGWGTASELFEALFDATVVQRIDLSLSADAVAALLADSESYVEGTLEHDGHLLEGVGVRLAGGASTWQPIDAKPNFRIKLDEFENDNAYGELSRINLHNMVGDATQAREVVSYAVWNAAGMVAPRANFAEVYVNGASYGLYANVEEPDEAFLDRHFADPDGDLWEAGDAADLTPGGVDNFAVAGGDGDEAALDAARRQVQLGEGAFYDVADTVLDMGQFLDFWAWQIVLGNSDGYPYQLDDYYLYGNPEVRGRYQFLPWNLDETWEDSHEWDAVTGNVAVQCAYDDACAALLLTHLDASLTAYVALDVSAVAQSAFTLTSPAVAADLRREQTLAEVQTARTAFAADVLNRPARVRGQTGL